MTTSFPQPIGMSASWDPELIKQAGEVTGNEARVIWHRHPDYGFSRWAPTVDLERDPRWGRNEEGYGEDPVLTGKMAGAYIEGMQGDDPKYLRCASTLKHFYGNNTEVGRGWKNSSIDPRNKYELYLEPFRRCIEESGAEGIMTAYNRINGTVGPPEHDLVWYESMDQLPDIDDYDIIKGKRTYRYFDGNVLYPFGYGLTYTTFAYDNYKISLKDNRLLEISLDVKNTGSTASDEVVQIYSSAPASRSRLPRAFTRST